MTIRRTSLPRCRVNLVEYIRRRALKRLYARRDAVDNLIRSLQNYAEVTNAPAAECIPISALRKWS